MATDVVVFLGPSLSATHARSILDAQYLPPVANGDVVRAVHQHSPSVIAIIDGVFAQRPAVRHKELLWAMSQGVSVHGAASMGALRAAELAEFGMVGHGLIYRWYRRTPLADDADVAVTMAPPELGSKAFSEALVDVRILLKAALRNAVICRETRVQLEETARTLHFSERRFETILGRARTNSKLQQAKEIDNLYKYLINYLVRQKTKDAICILENLKKERRVIKKTDTADFTVTENWLFDLEVCGIDRLIDFTKQRDD